MYVYACLCMCVYIYMYNRALFSLRKGKNGAFWKVDNSKEYQAE